AHDSPSGAVAPVGEIVEARLRDGVIERGDAERLGRRPCRRGARRPPPQPSLERARDSHRGGAGEPGDEPLADAAGDLLCGLHETTSTGLALPSAAAAVSTRLSRRSSRWSPTRNAFAIAVSAGFTALLEGKKLVSTTYRLSTSWARQLMSRAELAGSLPKRTVPHWWALPASGIRWSTIDQLGTALSWQPSGPIRAFSLPSSRLCGSRL